MTDDKQQQQQLICMTTTKSVTGMNTILNLHHANKALTEVHYL